MTIKEAAFKVEDIKLGLWELSGLMMAVNDAIYHGTFTPDAYEGAMFCILRVTQELENATGDLVEDMFGEARKASRENGGAA